jgi:hypothetical protein
MGESVAINKLITYNMINETVLDWLIDLHRVCKFQTREGAKFGIASNSELRRWCNQGALVINGEKITHDELMDFPIISIVLFPKGKRITLY